MAVALAIERLLESFFAWFEQSVQAVAEVIGAASKPVGWIKAELWNANLAMEEVARKTGKKATPEQLALFESAEKRLERAQQRLLDWVKEPNWVAFKRLFCVAVGLLVGNLVSVSGDLGALHMIGIRVPRILDMFATGLVIGAGPGPMHFPDRHLAERQGCPGQSGDDQPGRRDQQGVGRPQDRGGRRQGESHAVSQQETRRCGAV